MTANFKDFHISVPMIEFIDEFFEKTQKDFPDCIYSIKTNRSDFDSMTCGLETGLTVIAGRPSMGKTSFSLSIAIENSILNQKKCIFFSLESSKEAIFKKTISYVAGIDLLRIYAARVTEQHLERILESIVPIRDSNLYIIDSVYTVDGIESKVDEAGFMPDLIVVDSLQMLENHNPKTTRYRNLNEIILRLKRLSFKNKCPVILTSQLHKRLEMRADKRPVCSDFSESEFPAQAADKIIFMYRDDVYNENTPDKSIVEVICAKNKSGPIGKVSLNWIPQTGSYKDFVWKKSECSTRNVKCQKQ